jgi:flagellar biosynthesis protein FlhA
MSTLLLGIARDRILRLGLGVPLGLMIIMAMMILPIPPLLLDLFFTFSITLSMLILLAGIYALRPLDFAIFPTVLLLSTLMRLALNVASTRVVLLNGHTGPAAAGKVIEAFGEVVIGGNYAVGIVVFLILIIINFVVVTKGAGRISEVSARFTLDSLPGKQMSIDADLNAGLINQQEAIRRREDLSQEVDFYGSMDGASKFVRGDAIAGILILFINMIGGMCVGIFQHNLGFGQAAEVYALLTIGDGLVAQIPSLILSTAAALLVTRVSKAENMGQQFVSQLFGQFKPLMISSCIMIVMGLIPGMPHMAFIGLGILLGAIALLFFNDEVKQLIFKHTGFDMAKLFANNATINTEEATKQQLAEKEKDKDKEVSWDDVPLVDTLCIEIGYKLIPMVDDEQSAELTKRVKGVRKKLSQEFGFLIPPIHIKDNLDLLANAYRISIMGVVVGEDKVQPELELAINPGQQLVNLKGIHVKDPSFNLDAFWIDKRERQIAQSQGYTVVDASTVVATHLSQIIKEHAHQLLGHQEVEKMLSILQQDAPKLVENLVPDTLPLSIVVKVLQNLLIEHVPLKDIRTIAEVLIEYGAVSKNPFELTEYVRRALGPMIVQQINGFSKELNVATLSADLEQILHKSLQSNAGNVALEPNLADKLQNNLNKMLPKFEISGLPYVLLTSNELRAALAKLARAWVPDLRILSYQEVPDGKQIKVIASVGN